MSSGTVYVPAPYEAVQARTAEANNTISIPGNDVIVGGVYYRWVNNHPTDYGFSGANSWFTDVANGPTGSFFANETNKEQACQEYVDENNSLDKVFVQWDKSSDFAAYSAFANAIAQRAPSCGFKV